MKTKKRPTVAKLRAAFEKATKLSTILAIALHDLAKVERSKKFKVNMRWWYCKGSKSCKVCLAGSVMAGRYPNVTREFGKHRELWPEHSVWDGVDEVSQKFNALDCLRAGRVAAAMGYLRLSITHQHDREVTDYHKYPKQWWLDMKKLLADLRKAGL